MITIDIEIIISALQNVDGLLRVKEPGFKGEGHTLVSTEALQDARAQLTSVIASLEHEKVVVAEKAAKDDEYSQRGYYRDVEELAQLVLDEAIAEGSSEREVKRWIDRNGRDRVDELVDSNAWVIYYHNAAKVLQYSDNDDAIFDNGGDLSSYDNMGALHTAAACCAMVADVNDKLSRMVDEYVEPDEPEDDEDEDYDAIKDADTDVEEDTDACA